MYRHFWKLPTLNGLAARSASTKSLNWGTLGLHLLWERGRHLGGQAQLWDIYTWQARFGSAISALLGCI